MESIFSKMEGKLKIFFLGLVGLLAATLFFLVSTMSSKATLIRDLNNVRDEFSRKSEDLTKRANAAIEEKRVVESRLDAVQRDFERINREKTDLEKKYDLVYRERNDLVDRLKRREVPVETKAPPVSEDSYWSGILKEKTNLEIQVASLKDQLAGLKLNLDELKRDKVALELEKNNLARDKNDFETRIDYNEKVTDSLSSELVREKKDKRQYESELRSLKSEHAILLRQLKTLNSQKASLESRLAESEQSKVNLNKRITNMNDMLEYKLSQVVDVKKDLESIQAGSDAALAVPKGSIELPPIIVRSAAEAVTSEARAKVLAVNKDNNFVIVDLGEENAVKPGSSFDIYRDGKKIASVEVIQTRKNVSACDIKQISSPIKIGDEVR